VIVGYLHIVGVALPPLKANAPPVIDPNAVLSRSLSRHFLQVIRRWNPKVIERDGIIEHPQLAQRGLLNVRG